MGMRSAKEQGVKDKPDRNSEISANYSVDEKPKNEFLGNRRDHHCQNNNSHPLPNRLRAIEKIDNLLFARAAPKNALSHDFSHGDQRRGGQQEDDASADRGL